MTGRRRPPTRREMLSTLLAPVLAAVPVGCAWQRRHEARKIPQLGVIDPTQPRELKKVTLPLYVIEPPDELEIEVEPTLEYDIPRLVTVRADGIVDLGFGGDVAVAGLTLPQAERKIALLLNAQAKAWGEELEEPIRVSVRLSNPTRSKFYYVIGDGVSTQGQFPVQGGETVLQAILQAGLRPTALPEKAYLVRPQPPGLPDKVLRIDWVGIKQRGDPTTNYQIFPGDRVIVPGTRPPGLLQSLLGGG